MYLFQSINASVGKKNASIQAPNTMSPSDEIFRHVVDDLISDLHIGALISGDVFLARFFKFTSAS